ncbi:hypothetical protein MHK_000913 [Candidatus Magnetomorum sp. HK-1]|nr:hypothetical protein MHK_000913 [Candidatus Magnetomorum sp. HK-1]
MRISQIKLKQIGAYEDLSIDFKTNKDPQKAEIHIFSGVNGSGKSTIARAFFSSVNALGRPPFLPLALAAERPAIVLSLILSRSCSANRAKIPNTNRPFEDVVSNRSSVRLLKPTFLFLIS